MKNSYFHHLFYSDTRAPTFPCYVGRGRTIQSAAAGEESKRRCVVSRLDHPIHRLSRRVCCRFSYSAPFHTLNGGRGAVYG